MAPKGNEPLLESLRARIEQIETAHVGFTAEQSSSSAVTDDNESETMRSARSTDSHSSSSQAFSKIVALVNASDKSEKSIRERLSTSGFSEEDVDVAIAKAKDYSIIDDNRFADVLVRSRLAQGRGLSGIERELKQHDIDPLSVQTLQECAFSFDEQVDAAINVLSKKPPRSKNKREGAYRKLVQRGYSPSVASSASRMWVESSSHAIDEVVT